MTQRILGVLVVLLTVSLAGMPVSHAQGNERAEKGAKQKNENAQKRFEPKNNERAPKKFEIKKKREIPTEAVDTAPEPGKRKMELRAGDKSMRVEGRPVMRDLRQASRKDGVPMQRSKVSAKWVRAQQKQIDLELHKHAKRLATIERLIAISEKQDNAKLGERAKAMRVKELERHTRRLARLKRQRVPMERVVKPNLQMERKKVNPKLDVKKMDAQK